MSPQVAGGAPDVARREGLDPGAVADGSAVSCELIELYVALKSKPMAILLGPAGSGKLAVARALAARLASPGATCFQEMVGHAWWASRSGGVALFTEAQQRFNHEKMLAMVEEAVGEPIGERVRVALLSRISPAEWSDLAALAAPLYPGFSLRDAGPGARRRPVAWRNLLVIATADDAAPAPWDSDLLRTTSILPCSERKGVESAPSPEPGWPEDAVEKFGGQVLRAPGAALRRLRSLAGWRDERLRPVLAIPRAMRSRGIPEANCAASEALVYLANAWTGRGEGLFAGSFEENLRSALRLAVVLAYLPRLEGWPALPHEAVASLEAILGDRVPPASTRSERPSHGPQARSELRALDHTRTTVASAQEGR